VSEELELAIDRTRCDGSRLCAELLPERIRLDDWGYPIIAPGAIPPGLLQHARRAVAACPLLALSLRQVALGLERPHAPFTCRAQAERR
jgi:ferredoxin